jgi:hypothetical protein
MKNGKCERPENSHWKFISDAGLLIKALSFAGCCILYSVFFILYSEFFILYSVF